MPINLHNTLTKKIDELQPLNPGQVTIYSCGPTVYDHVHIGNLSAFIAADVLRRAITAQGLSTKHIMNFTDVDDKTIARSKEAHPDLEPAEALKKLTKHYGGLFLKDMEAVGNDTAALTFVKAADDASIEAMQTLITELYTGGFAYAADDGVYFSIDAYRKSGKTYGQLVEITAENTASERIDNDEYDKESAHDFALWKKRKDGEPAWEFTIDGHDMTGRPGWHIECSAMSRLELGQPFDIHTGGVDLMFPHHENEIAQNTAGHDDPTYARMFVHNEHILVDGKKMAKSAGNFYTLHDIKKKGVDPLAFRLLVLQSHYRKPTNFSLENAHAAMSRLQHWRNVAELRHQTHATLDEYDDNMPSLAAIGAIREALANDLNTPEALSVIDDVFTHLESHSLDMIYRDALIQLLEAIDDMLGLRLIDSTPDISDDQKKLLLERQRARDEKDFGKSDDLREALKKQGIDISDTPAGQVWRRA